MAFTSYMKPETIARRAAQHKAERITRRTELLKNLMTKAAQETHPGSIWPKRVVGMLGTLRNEAVAGDEIAIAVLANHGETV